MNHELENIGRRLPYNLPPQGLDALQERIRNHTTARTAPMRSASRRLYLAAGTTAAALLFAAGILVSEHRGNKAAVPAPDIEQMLATAPTETLQQAAAENYDDILYNQQL